MVSNIGPYAQRIFNDIHVVFVFACQLGIAKSVRK